MLHEGVTLAARRGGVAGQAIEVAQHGYTNVSMNTEARW